MHKVIGQIQAAIDIPFLHIADPVGQAALDVAARRVGLLGTAFTMACFGEVSWCLFRQGDDMIAASLQGFCIPHIRSPRLQVPLRFIPCNRQMTDQLMTHAMVIFPEAAIGIITGKFVQQEGCPFRLCPPRTGCGRDGKRPPIVPINPLRTFDVFHTALHSEDVAVRSIFCCLRIKGRVDTQHQPHAH
ncbi:hypothetical protein ACS77_28700 [Pseudomonas syringae]|uniref:Uncharacterized protein n=1 Tax=Pseudomonas syringae TaxID=317 RepID=A0A0L1LHT5_PSESX|nr:hypothetical protein ACS77_28700 [Pseudomonas syringae]